MLVRLEENIDPTLAPYVGDEQFWADLPSYTIPMDLPGGMAVAFNVKGPIDPVTGMAKFVRFLRSYCIKTDSFSDRVDYLVNPEHDCFKNLGTVSDPLVTAEDDSSIILNPDYVVVKDNEQVGPDNEQ